MFPSVSIERRAMTTLKRVGQPAAFDRLKCFRQPSSARPEHFHQSHPFRRGWL